MLNVKLQKQHLAHTNAVAMPQSSSSGILPNADELQESRLVQGS